MGHQRQTAPLLVTGSTLDANMVGIGMLFVAKRAQDPDIEDTLISASLLGMDHPDLRVLSVLSTWIEIHSARINADRLIRGLAHVRSSRVLAFWAGVGNWLEKDRRLKRLREFHQGNRVNLLSSGMSFFLRRDGEDQRFAGGPLVVPGKALRNRSADVAGPEQLASYHSVYRWRLIMGPSYRADLWALLENDAELSVSELARRVRCSIGAAWQAKRDRDLLAAA